MRSFNPIQDTQHLAVQETGYGSPPPHFRSALEMDRLAWRRTPEATYPNGYIDSSMTTRREDKVQQAIWRNQRSYTRGVHKGERIDMSDYLWPQEFNLASGLVNQATTGLRYVSPAMSEEPKMLTNDGKPGPALNPDGTPVPINPDRAAQLSKFKPPWSV